MNEHNILTKYSDVIDEMKNTMVKALLHREKDLEKKLKDIDGELADILREAGRKAIEDLAGKLHQHVVKKKQQKD